MNGLRRAVWLARERQFRALLRRLRPRVWHDERAIGLSYDLATPIRARMPRIDVEVRPIRREDVPVFVTPPPPSSSGPPHAVTRATARHLLESGLQTCYVGVTKDGPVYMQFLVTSDQNDRLADVFGNLFPPLAEDEGLLEFAFTLNEHRPGLVMPSALIRLLEIASERGLRRVVAYVPAGSTNLIRFFLRLGFTPFAIRFERYRFFRRAVEILPVDDELLTSITALQPQPASNT